MYCLASTDNLTTKPLRKINNVYRRQLSERKKKNITGTGARCE